MGINWILEVVSALYPQANNVWRFVDAYNVMIGFFIFVIFVCKKKILRLMKKRFVAITQHLVIIMFIIIIIFTITVSAVGLPLLDIGIPHKNKLHFQYQFVHTLPTILYLRSYNNGSQSKVKKYLYFEVKKWLFLKTLLLSSSLSHNSHQSSVVIHHIF